MTTTPRLPWRSLNRFTGAGGAGERASARRRRALRRRSRSRRRALVRRAQVIERVELASSRARSLGIVGPSGCGKSTLLELIAGLREPSAATIAVGGERGAAGPPRPLRLHAAARPAPALALGDRQRRARAAEPGRLAERRGAPRGRTRSSSASGSPASSGAARASSPAGCASGSRSCARCWPASRCCCSTSRSPRSTRSRAPRCRSGWPRRSPAESRDRRPRHATTSRRRSTSPTGWSCSRPRPARAVGELRCAGAARAGRAPRSVTSAEFTAARERALDALPRGRR